MSTFEDLRAFQLAVELSADVYKATATFPREEIYGLTSQLRRASCSVVSNIAEGSGRLTYGEWRQSLSQARGSLYEVQAQLTISVRLELLSAETADQLKSRIRATGRALTGLINWVSAKRMQKRPTTDNR